MFNCSYLFVNLLFKVAGEYKFAIGTSGFDGEKYIDVFYG